MNTIRNRRFTSCSVKSYYTIPLSHSNLQKESPRKLKRRGQWAAGSLGISSLAAPKSTSGELPSSIDDLIKPAETTRLDLSEDIICHKLAEHCPKTSQSFSNEV